MLKSTAPSHSIVMRLMAALWWFSLFIQAAAFKQCTNITTASLVDDYPNLEVFNLELLTLSQKEIDIRYGQAIRDQQLWVRPFTIEEVDALKAKVYRSILISKERDAHGVWLEPALQNTRLGMSLLSVTTKKALAIYYPAHQAIFLKGAYTHSEEELADVLTHELRHAFVFLRNNALAHGDDSDCGPHSLTYDDIQAKRRITSTFSYKNSGPVALPFAPWTPSEASQIRRAFQQGLSRILVVANYLEFFKNGTSTEEMRRELQDVSMLASRHYRSSLELVDDTAPTIIASPYYRLEFAIRFIQHIYHGIAKQWEESDVGLMEFDTIIHAQFPRALAEFFFPELLEYDARQTAQWLRNFEKGTLVPSLCFFHPKLAGTVQSVKPRLSSSDIDPRTAAIGICQTKECVNVRESLAAKRP